MSSGTARSVGALIALSVSTFAYVTTETLPIGLLLPIADDLESTASAVGLLVTGYGLVVVLTSIPLTYLTRRVPRRSLMTGLLGIFVAATIVSALAPDYSILMSARIVTALSQALFWSIVVPTAAGLFSARVRGRVLGIVMSGNSLAAVLGVPVGTWLGQQAGWRASFFALSGLGLLAMLGTGWLLPGGPARQGAAARGEAPDARLYALLMATTILAVTGAFAAFTFITPYLVDVAAFSAAAISPILLIRGLAGVAGVTAGGWLVDHRPMVGTVVPVAMQAVALLGLVAFKDVPALVTIMVGVSGLSFAAFTTALGARILRVAPGTKDLAAAGASTAVNVGITVGALIGGLLLSASSALSAVLVGGLLSIAALAAAMCEPLARRPSLVVIQDATSEPEAVLESLEYQGPQR